MNELHNSDKLNKPKMQIWNNAAFDNQETMNPILANSASFEPNLGKENHTSLPSSANIDAEIEAVEKEIRRLTSRLESLRLEKLAQSIKITEKRGKVVASKFMEPKKVDRRGVSLGPVEIYGSARKQLGGGKREITPTQNRRISCFWKLGGIDEVKKSMSLSPKSRKMVSRIEACKQAMTTVGSKRGVKKDSEILLSVQPKMLFKDAESSKKAVKPGRIVASRYNQINGNSALKRSLPENGKIDGMRSDKRRASVIGKSSRARNKWQIPNKVGFSEDVEAGEDEFTSAIPRIKTDRGVGKTPRDSGKAKRVAELVGRKSYFCSDEEAGESVCQALKFAEEN